MAKRRLGPRSNEETLLQKPSRFSMFPQIFSRFPTHGNIAAEAKFALQKQKKCFSVDSVVSRLDFYFGNIVSSFGLLRTMASSDCHFFILFVFDVPFKRTLNADCLIIQTSSGLRRVCLKIPFADRYAVEIRKIPNLTPASRSDTPRRIFSSNPNSANISFGDPAKNACKW